MTEQKLLECRHMKGEKDYLENRISELECQLYTISSPSFSPSYGGGNEDKITNLIESINELLQRLLQKRQDAINLEAEIEEEIKMLPYDEQLVIRLYYISAINTWDEVADKMARSPSTVYVLRHNALKRLKGEKE